MTRSSGSSLRLILSTARYSGTAGSSVWAASAASGESDADPELAVRRPERHRPVFNTVRAAADDNRAVLTPALAGRSAARDVDAFIVGTAGAGVDRLGTSTPSERVASCERRRSGQQSQLATRESRLAPFADRS